MTIKVCVAGVGMTVFGRLAGASVKSLTRDAVEEALVDAGLLESDVELALFGNVTQGYYENLQFTRGQIALRALGFGGASIVNVENACATGATAFAEAARAIRAGDVEVAIAVGVEKMTGFDKERTLGFFDAGWDRERLDETRAALRQMGDGLEIPADFASPGDHSVMMDVYAAFARFHMKTFGTRIEHFAAVAAKNHQHAVHNPNAQYRKSMTVDEVLAGRRLAYPLTVPMCAPITDGAAAAVLVSEAFARRNSKRTVRVLAAQVRSSVNRKPADVELHIARRTALAAYERAGVDPADVCVAEVHDATAVGEVIHIENLGFCPIGEGGPFSASGATTLGGRIPVNPSGGLESKGHPIAASGLGQIHEIVTQLRGEAGPRQVRGARIGICENSGGVWASRKR